VVSLNFALKIEQYYIMPDLREIHSKAGPSENKLFLKQILKLNLLSAWR
jgi:hypothetical protein